MANKSVFGSLRGRLVSKFDTLNKQGAPAYSHDADHKLAQLAMSGTFGDIFYQSAETELAEMIKVADLVEPEFLAKTAIYARENGHMKDMPAFMLAVLSSRDATLFSRVFPRIVTNGKMLRNFVQIMRSGQTGRKSLGSRPKAMVASWLNTASDRALLQASVGNNPSLADVIKMVHPKPASPQRDALFAWLIGKPCDVALLPGDVREYISFMKTGAGKLPDVPFQMLTHLQLTTEHWSEIALTASWQMVRMNLNTFLRHKVLEDKDVVAHVASVLRDPERIASANGFPYQLMTAYQALSDKMPNEVCEALHDAMELSVANVPKIEGKIVVCPDVSGSMNSPVTGYRKGATSVTRFVDVAGLVSAAFLRRNPTTMVLPFEYTVCGTRLEPRDTILTNARKLADLGGGGTNCSAPLELLIKTAKRADLIIYVSDNQSWADVSRGHGNTAMMQNWERFKIHNPKAKLVCIDIAPYGTTQVKSRDDILNIGGFSDAVFDQIANFATDKMGPAQWVGEIEKMEL